MAYKSITSVNPKAPRVITKETLYGKRKGTTPPGIKNITKGA